MMYIYQKNDHDPLLSRSFCTVLFCALLLFLVSCRVMPELDNGEIETLPHNWSAGKIAQEFTGNDPIEPFNRTMFACTDFCMHYIVRPIGYIYGSILPLEVIKRIDYASDNLAFPSRMFSCFLQGQFKNGGVEFLRFLTNSTIGIAGFFDPADAWFGLPRQNEDFGQTFGYWNIGQGAYFMLPFMASNNVRDCVGAIFDRATDLKSYIPYIGYLTTLNSAVNSYDSYASLTENAYDPYDFSKVFLGVMRYAHTENYHYKLLQAPPSDFGKKVIPQGPYEADVMKVAGIYGAQNPLIDTLKSAFFQVKKNNSGWWIKTSLWNTDFIPAAKTRSIKFAGSEDEMDYQIWCQENPEAPLVLLLPGAGGHFRAGMLRALAELYYDNGCSVAVMASTLNPEFFIPANLGLPGDVKRDVKKIREAFSHVISYAKKELEMKPEKIIAGGYSLGALHLLHLAAMEEKADTLKIDRYVVINPPVDLLYALKMMDSFCDIPKNMTRREFTTMASDAAMKIFLASSGRKGPLGVLLPQKKKNGMKEALKQEEKKKNTEKKENKKDEEQKGILWQNPMKLPLSPEQAGWISGIYMRFGLRELLLAAQKHSPEGKNLLKTPYSWGSRTALYREIDTYSWLSYAEKLLLSHIKKEEKDPSLSLASLGERASLRGIKTFLQNTKKVKIIHNLDDPLLSYEDILFLDRTMKKNLLFFDCGGHLGNMFLPIYQRKLLELALDKKWEQKKTIPAEKLSQKK